MKRKSYRAFYVAIILAAVSLVIIIHGCGGGGGGGGGSAPGGGVPVPTTTAPTVTPTTSPPTTLTGQFQITLMLPKPRPLAFERNGKVIPQTRKWLCLSVTGENITTPIAPDPVDISTGPGPFTIAAFQVPVGRNMADIWVADATYNRLAHRRHGFFMIAGGVTQPETIHLGVGLEEGTGHCNPPRIDVPNGTMLYFENWDTSVARSVKSGGVDLVTGVPPMHLSVGPTDPDQYEALSCLLNVDGTYIYDPGFGNPPAGTGRVNVYSNPVLTSIDDGGPFGGDYNPTSASSLVTFDLVGNYLNDTPGTINFYDANDFSTVYTATNGTWTNTGITGSTITIPASKYFIQVTTNQGENTIDAVFYWKGAGNYPATVD